MSQSTINLSAARHADLERLMCSYLEEARELMRQFSNPNASIDAEFVESPNPQEAKANASDPDL